MDEVQTSLTPFPSQEAVAWIGAYQEEMLTAKNKATIEAYTRILEKFAEWLALRPGTSGQFHPRSMTRTAIEGFLETLPSFSYKKQARRTIRILSLVAGGPAAPGARVWSVAFRSQHKPCSLRVSCRKTSAM